MTYIIAETGINHQGSEDLLLYLVSAAHSAGVDAVKFQHWNAETINRSYEVKGILRSIQLGWDSILNARRMAHMLNLQSIVSVYEERHALEAKMMGGWDYLKIGHGEQDEEWPERIEGIPVLRSFTEPRETRHIPMIVGSQYPTSITDANSLLAQMAGRVDPWGYSDHTGWVGMGEEAVVAGARFIEAHLCLEHDSNNPDDAVSLTPDEMAEYVRLARSVESRV